MNAAYCKIAIYLNTVSILFNPLDFICTFRVPDDLHWVLQDVGTKISNRSLVHICLRVCVCVCVCVCC